MTITFITLLRRYPLTVDASLGSVAHSARSQWSIFQVIGNFTVPTFALAKSHGGLRIRSIFVEALKTCSAVRITVGGGMLAGTRVQQPGRVTQAFRVIVHLNPGNKSEEEEYYAGSYFFAGKQVLSFLTELQINQ